MSSLTEGDFDLDGHVLGREHRTFVTAFKPGASNWIVQDEQNPVASQLRMGRDFLGPPGWDFNLAVHGRNAEEVLAELSALMGKWNNPLRTPETEQVLRYCIAGRVRRIYGRARKFGYNPNASLAAGRILASGSFQTKDSCHYADEAESLHLSLIPGNAGGLFSPLVSPLTTVAGGTRQGIVTVDGDAPAPMEITFRGPVTNPSASSTGWVVSLNTSLAYDQSVTVDTRRGTVFRNDGASLGGALSRHTYLPEARLQPGAREVVFTGTDPTGTASCTVVWRPTYYGF